MSHQGVLFRKMAEKEAAVRNQGLTEPPDIQAFKDIDYAGDKSIWHRLDVYVPQNTAGRLPLIVSVHGGGFVHGTKELYRFYGMFLAQQGFAVVNYNYSLAPEAQFPTQVEESCRMLEWCAVHADEYHMDPDNVFMTGDSSGANMVNQLALMYSNPDYAKLFSFRLPQKIRLGAVALNCGIYTLKVEEKDSVDHFSNGMLDIYLGKDRGALGEVLEMEKYTVRDYPPAYVMTSYYDFYRKNAEPMYHRLRSRGVECVMKCYGTQEQKYMDHACNVKMRLPEAKEINLDECAFFRRHISPSPGVES